jgi:hypothetical protein
MTQEDGEPDRHNRSCLDDLLTRENLSAEGRVFARAVAGFMRNHFEPLARRFSEHCASEAERHKWIDAETVRRDKMLTEIHDTLHNPEKGLLRAHTDRIAETKMRRRLMWVIGGALGVISTLLGIIAALKHVVEMIRNGIG